jgi:recombination protein RecA
VGVTFGAPTTMIAEHPLMFHSSVVLDLSRIEILTREATKEAYAIKTRAKVIKNKIGPPFREAEFIIDFTHGIDSTESLLKLGMKFGIVGLAGSYYKIGKFPGFLMKDAKVKMAELNINLVEMIEEAMQNVDIRETRTPVSASSSEANTASK